MRGKCTSLVAGRQMFSRRRMDFFFLPFSETLWRRNYLQATGSVRIGTAGRSSFVYQFVELVGQLWIQGFQNLVLTERVLAVFERGVRHPETEMSSSIIRL